jgi:AcrR family transcriptional regulator
MSSAVPELRDDAEPDDGRRRICVAAMKCFAAHGSAGASLRMVATTAGVSVGLVQHHFGVKSALIAAVDEELVAILAQAAPKSPPTGDTVADLNSRLTTLIAEHPDAVDYLARLLVDGQPAGRQVFDLLLGFGRSQWCQLHSQATLRGGGQDEDAIWGALNPLILILGTLILRGHIDRQLPEPLDSPAQLRAWSAGLDDVIRGARRRHPSAIV